MSENFDIEELLKTHLSDASEPSPPDVFEKIEARIGDKERRKKRFFIWFWFGAGLFVLLTGVLLAALKGDELPKDQVVQNHSSNTIEQADGLGDRTEIDTVRNFSNTNTDMNNQSISNSNTLTDKIIDKGTNEYTEQTTTEDKPKKSTNRADASASEPAFTQTLKSNGTTSLPNRTFENKAETNTSTNPNDDQAANNHTEINKHGDKSRGFSGKDLSSIGQESIAQNENELSNDLIDTTADNSTQNNHSNKPVTETEDIHTNDTTRQAELAIAATQGSDDILQPETATQENSRDNNHTEDQFAEDYSKINDMQLSKQEMYPTSTTSQIVIGDSSKNTFGLMAYGGYMAFDQAVFKSYFTSGNLSNRLFPSMGYEIGLGAYYRIKKRLEITINANYGQRHTMFNYDLMISEDDFFNNYENDLAIPIENLDDPNSCNCFLAEDANLDYQTQTISIGISASYNLINTSKFSIGPMIGFGTIASTKFKNQNSSIINFSSELSELFTGSILRLGINLNYQLTPKIQLGLAPSFNFQYANQSLIYAKNTRLLFVPIQLKLDL